MSPSSTPMARRWNVKHSRRALTVLGLALLLVGCKAKVESAKTAKPGDIDLGLASNPPVAQKSAKKPADTATAPDGFDSPVKLGRPPGLEGMDPDNNPVGRLEDVTPAEWNAVLRSLRNKTVVSAVWSQTPENPADLDARFSKLIGLAKKYQNARTLFMVGLTGLSTDSPAYEAQLKTWDPPFRVFCLDETDSTGPNPLMSKTPFRIAIYGPGQPIDKPKVLVSLDDLETWLKTNPHAPTKP